MYVVGTISVDVAEEYAVYLQDFVINCTAVFVGLLMV